MSALMVKKTDPPIRADGRCAVCRKRRGAVPKGITQRSKEELIRNLERDPFCSTVCARAWHDNPTPESAGGELA